MALDIPSFAGGFIVGLTLTSVMALLIARYVIWAWDDEDDAS